MKNNKKGFTLVELVIVVAVMAILVAVAIPTISSITSSAQEAVFDTNCRTIESVLKLEEAEQSNDDNEYTLTASDAQTALDEAKLGIEGGTFYYHSTGIVDGTSTDATFTITYAEDGTVTCS